jgi:uncharacterized protein Smg (DUF494 family)
MAIDDRPFGTEHKYPIKTQVIEKKTLRLGVLAREIVIDAMLRVPRQAVPTWEAKWVIVSNITRKENLAFGN